MDQQLATHNEQLDLQAQIEIAMAHAAEGIATRDDLSLLQWAGIDFDDKWRD